MNRLTNEVKQKNFTFDYEGNIIIQQQLKTENLPPTQASMGYIVEDQRKVIQQMDNATTKQERSQLERPKKKLLSSLINPGKNKKQQKECIFITPPTIFDTINPLYGVTYIENGKVKAGPKQKLQSLSLLNSLKLTGNNNSIRLSKDEYSNLTKQGNLNLSYQDDTANSIIKAQDQSKLLSEDLSSLLADQTNHNQQIYSNNKSIINKSLNTNSFIKIQNMKNFSEFLQPLQIKEDNSNNKTENFLPKITLSSEIQLNSFDQFNMSILRQKQSWGTSGQANQKESLPLMPQIKNQQSLFKLKKKLPIGDRLRKYKLPNKEYCMPIKKKSLYYLG